jgi:glycosyltransferase involved in cell wall biosynthesis
MSGIAVITFCLDREKALLRCIKSVQAQKHFQDVVHYIFSERTNELRSSPILQPYEDLVKWIPIAHPVREHSSPRMAKLRQAALQHIQEPCVCFLDDDNEFLPDHLSSLLNCFQNQKLDAAYSWRILCHSDGRLFAGNYYPWHPDPKIAESLYQWCVQNKVMRSKDPIVYDGPNFSNDPRNVATVDMNEWLFRTKSLLSLGFDLEFTQEELNNQVGEDDKLLRKILAANFNFTCSQQATVRYYLGGVSNSTISVSYTNLTLPTNGW